MFGLVLLSNYATTYLKSIIIIIVKKTQSYYCVFFTILFVADI